jgi:hypothetical protein
MWDFWWTKLNYGSSSPRTSVYLVNHSTDCSTVIVIIIIIHHLGLIQ